MLALNLPGFAPKVAEKDGKRTIFDPVRQKYVALTPEEWVRQHFVNYLITRKSYPKELLANEVLVKLNGTSKRCDTVAYSRFLEPLVIVEYKAPHINITNTVFDQIARYNMVLRVEYLIVSNGLNHYCCKIDYNNRAYTFFGRNTRIQRIINIVFTDINIRYTNLYIQMPGPFLSKQGGKNPLHPHLHACTPGCRLLEHPDVRPPYTRMFTDKCS